MIVDFHTHTYPDKIASKTLELLVSRSKTKPASDGTLAGLQHSMAQSGVDISVVLPDSSSVFEALLSGYV